jgi:hypothetical protein
MWRVSTVLSLTGLSTPYSFSEVARDRGTAVHAFNHGYALKRITTVEADDPYAPQKTALMRWYKEFDPLVIAVERRITSTEKRLTGRIDLAIVHRDTAIIVDVKTGGKSPVHGIQVCGYCDLAHSDSDLTDRVLKHTFGPWQRAVLYLQDSGSYHWRGPMTLLREGPQDDFLFRAAHALICWKYDHQLLSVMDSETPDDDRELDNRCQTLI